MISRRLLLQAGCIPLAGCASRIVPAEGWHDVPIPGKRPTHYSWERKGDRLAIHARAESSASMWRRRVDVPADRLGFVGFSWWVDALIAGADLAHAERTDTPAQVLFGFGGDVGRLAPRTRLMYELAQALTGEEPPFATLSYVWANEAPVDSIMHNPRTDRVRKIVADSGPQQLGRWRDHRRDLAADFLRVYGEPPGPLVSIAVMTDADNTSSSARAWYAPPTLG